MEKHDKTFETQIETEDLKIPNLPEREMIPSLGGCVDLGIRQAIQLSLEGLRAKDSDRLNYLSKLERLWNKDPSKERVLVSYCVRSAIDVYLQAKNFPPGSEIIMTALTIPDMPRIIREHGYVPVPLDINLEDFSPVSPQALEELITPKTKAVIFAFIFGTFYDLDPYIDILEKRGIDTIQDCAQSFEGAQNFSGNMRATVTMFSFGLIKTSTSLNGAVSIIRSENHHLFKKMRDIQDTYPLITKKMYWNRAKKGIMCSFIQLSFFTKMLLNHCRTKGINEEEFFIQLVRGFTEQPVFLEKFRIRPNASLLYFMYARQSNFDEQRFQQNRAKVRKLTEYLLKSGLVIPGKTDERRNFWLYPIVQGNRKLYLDLLIRYGVNAGYSATQMDYIRPNEGYKAPPNAIFFTQNVFYIPAHIMTSEARVEEIGKRVVEVHKVIEQMLKMKKETTWPVVTSKL